MTKNVTRLWGGKKRQGNDVTDRGSIVFSCFLEAKKVVRKCIYKIKRPLVMAFTAEVVLGLSYCASLVPVMHLWTCPTFAYGLLVGLCTVCYIALYFSFSPITILFRLGYSLFSCKSSCFKAYGFSYWEAEEDFQWSRGDSETAEFHKYFQSSL